MPQAIMIRNYGAADALVLEEIEVRAPAPSELLLRQTAIGVNFHDIYVRSGLYKTLPLPGIPGCEAVGVIEAVGGEVEGFEVGDRVAYVTGPPYGAYASHRLLPATAAVPLADNVEDDIVAANFLRALTVDMLTRRVTRLNAGMSILVHAAAGGVGRLLCQTAAKLGVTVIGTVGSPDKADIARSSGCVHPILYRETAFQDEVMRLTGGRGVDAVFDSIGADTLEGSLSSLALCGHFVIFGQSSGPSAPLAVSTLAEKSLTVTRPILFHYLRNHTQYQAMARSALAAFATGALSAEDPLQLPLGMAAKAHDLLESRAATAGLVLKP